MTLEQYRIIKEVYEEYYPKEQLDIIVLSDTLKAALEGKPCNVLNMDLIENEYSVHMYAVVYHPSLTLTNDKGEKYTITDVYVETFFPNFSIQLGRTSYTEAEAAVGYRHSHISTGGFEEMSPFCTGDGSTPVNVLKSMYLHNDFSDFRFFVESFIIETERMIRIESNEGGPYMSFSNVGKAIEKTPLSVPLWGISICKTQQVTKLMREFIDYYCSLHLDTFYYDGRNWQLDATDTEFIDRVTEAAKTWKKTSKAPIYVPAYKIDGIYYLKGDLGYTMPKDMHAKWTFKGQHPEIRIIDGNTAVHPVQVVGMVYLSNLYNFLLELVNGIYAGEGQYRDCLYTRAKKIKTALLRQM